MKTKMRNRKLHLSLLETVAWGSVHVNSQFVRDSIMIDLKLTTINEEKKEETKERLNKQTKGRMNKQRHMNERRKEEQKQTKATKTEQTNKQKKVRHKQTIKVGFV